jgi:hypothetical protein
MPPRRRLSALLAAGVLAAGLLGCSDDPSPPAASPAPTAVASAERVRAAALQTGLQGSARYSLLTTTTVDGEELVFAGEGSYDWRIDKGRTTFHIPDGAVEQRRLGDDVFFVLPQQAGVFFRIPALQLAMTPVGGAVDPTAQLPTLTAVTDIEPVGQAEVRGARTMHYRGSYDVLRAITVQQGVNREAIKAVLGPAVRAEEMPYDVYLDEAGRLRRLEQSIDMTDQDGRAVSVRATLELYDFGLTVYVPGPEADKIRDGAPLLAALRTGLSARPPSPSPGAPSPGTDAPSPEAGS